MEEYSKTHLEWIFIREFSWHSVTIMLTSVLKDHWLEPTDQRQRAQGRIDRLFKNRHTIDYLAGNGNLWKPLLRLWMEFQTLEKQGRNVPDVGILQGKQINNWETEIIPQDTANSFVLDYLLE
jgi:hypothetical protein